MQEPDFTIFRPLGYFAADAAATAQLLMEAIDRLRSSRGRNLPNALVQTSWRYNPSGLISRRAKVNSQRPVSWSRISVWNGESYEFEESWNELRSSSLETGPDFGPIQTGPALKDLSIIFTNPDFDSLKTIRLAEFNSSKINKMVKQFWRSWGPGTPIALCSL